MMQRIVIIHIKVTDPKELTGIRYNKIKGFFSTDEEHLYTLEGFTRFINGVLWGIENPKKMTIENISYSNTRV